MNAVPQKAISTAMDNACRLCGQRTHAKFTLRLMQRLNVTYHECAGCGSLQTDEPHWLDEAYRDAVRYTDTFTGQRATVLPPLTLYLSRVARLGAHASLLDWGGGNGLTVRLLRDLGLDAYSYDLYEKPTYAAGFEGGQDRRYSIITAFEVLEHMAHPGRELGSLFDRQPDMVLCTTWLYRGQGPDWEYLAPYSGRHIFFFTARSLQALGRSRGYECICDEGSSYILFLRKSPGRVARALIRWGLQEKNQRAVRAWFALFPPEGLARRDQQLMRQRVGDTARVIEPTP